MVQAKPEKYGKDFDAIMPFLGQMFKKNGYYIQCIHISKTTGQPAKIDAFHRDGRV